MDGAGVTGNKGIRFCFAVESFLEAFPKRSILERNVQFYFHAFINYKSKEVTSVSV